MSLTDLTFDELLAMAYTELKVPSTSEAYPITLMQRLLNEGYVDIFNEPKKNLYFREASKAFQTIPDTDISSPFFVGDTVINVNSTSGYPSAGAILYGQNIINYTGKTATSFTGCTNVNHNSNPSETTIRPLYLLTDLASDIDEQQVRAVEMEGDPLDYLEFDRFIAHFDFSSQCYTIFNGYLALSRNNVTRRAYLHYFKKIVPMVLSTDKPVFVPNANRGIIVFYAVGRAMILDDKRTGWELYYNYNAQQPDKSSGLYFEWKRDLYAKYSRRIDSKKRRSGSIYD